jgi:hypothetical protein
MVGSGYAVGGGDVGLGGGRVGGLSVEAWVRQGELLYILPGKLPPGPSFQYSPHNVLDAGGVARLGCSFFTYYPAVCTY